MGDLLKAAENAPINTRWIFEIDGVTQKIIKKPDGHWWLKDNNQIITDMKEYLKNPPLTIFYTFPWDDKVYFFYTNDIPLYILHPRPPHGLIQDCPEPSRIAKMFASYKTCTNRDLPLCYYNENGSPEYYTKGYMGGIQICRSTENQLIPGENWKLLGKKEAFQNSYQLYGPRAWMEFIKTQAPLDDVNFIDPEEYEIVYLTYRHTPNEFLNNIPSDRILIFKQNKSINDPMVLFNLVDPKKRMIIINLNITFASKNQKLQGHANMILVDQKQKEIQIFDPHGNMTIMTSKELQISRLKKYLWKLFPDYQINLPAQVCPYLGPQIQSKDMVGYCLAWTYWWLLQRLKGKTANEINQMTRHMSPEELRHTIYNFVNEFYTFADRVTQQQQPTGIIPTALKILWGQETPTSFYPESKIVS